MPLALVPFTSCSSHHHTTQASRARCAGEDVAEGHGFPSYYLNTMIVMWLELLLQNICQHFDDCNTPLGYLNYD